MDSKTDCILRDTMFEVGEADARKLGSWDAAPDMDEEELNLHFSVNSGFSSNGSPVRDLIPTVTWDDLGQPEGPLSECSIPMPAHVFLVTHPELGTFIVNTEGYDYARYIWRLA